ncbi:carbohydrate-binding protein [Cohnella sp. GCM10012308]|uniref:carbohydrate-binding protein n=1 Tax=Cohnella sp. GCM10012308 TaxID=3317329 RepID=UPI00361B96F1
MRGNWRKRIQMGMAVLLLISATIQTAGKARADEPVGAALYVSAAGSDTNPGTEAAPFATIERAREEIRSLKLGDDLPAGGVTVYLRGGVYARSETFALGEQDSGTASSPIVYAAYPDEEVRFTGSATLDGDDYRVVSDPAVLARLPSSVHGSVYEYDLAGAGISNYGSLQQYGFHMPEVDPPAELFYEDEPMTLSRWPNSGYVLTGTVTDPGAEGPPARGAVFAYADERPEQWSDPSDVWMYGYWYWDWADGNMKIDAIDAANNRITTESPTYFSVRGGQRYYYYNVLEELDSPGEWYLDRGAGKLYFYPPATLSGEATELSLLDEPLVSMDEVDYVTFQGITFENARNLAVRIEGGSYSGVADCVLRNLGNIAVSIQGGYRNGVSGSLIYNTGRGGILLEGGDRDTLGAGELYASDNEIHDYSRVQATYSPAIELRGAGNRAEHNQIYNAPHLAILIHGNNHVIEYNDIHDVLQETDDAGAIYMGMDWTEQGNVIRFNYLHDLPRIGVYLDDLASGTLVYGNVFARVDQGMLLGGGRDNTVVNNMLIDGNSSFLIDDRGLGWQHIACEAGGVLRTKLAEVPYDQEPWTSRYPNLAGVLTDNPCSPMSNTVRQNVFYRTPDLSAASAAVELGSIDGNWQTSTNPGFEDESGGNYALTAGAAVFTAIPGFKPIPFEAIGPRPDGAPASDPQTPDTLTLFATGSALRVGTGVRLWSIADTVYGTYLDTFGHLAYTSSDPAVASVDSLGNVLGLSVGETEVTATAAYGSIVLSDTIRLQVMESLLDGVSLSLDKPGAEVGHTASIAVSGTMTGGAAADLAEASIQYESSDDAIAEVSGSGIVTAKKLGYVSLTARVTLDGVLKSASVLFAVYPDGSGDPSAPWQLRNFGATLGAAYKHSNGDLSLIGNGADVFGSADAFTYLFQPTAQSEETVATSVTAIVYALDGTNADAAAGLMFRGGDAASSDNVMLRVLPGGGLRMTYRNAANPGSWFIVGPDASYPVELKLTRENDWYIGYYKSGGLWTEVGQVQAELGNTPNAGLAMFSHQSLPAEARFGNVSIDETPMELTRLEAAAGNHRLASGQTLDLQMRGVLGSHLQVELPGAQFTYATSDASVATVDAAGIVTAVGLGSSTISVTTSVYGYSLSGAFDIEVVATRDPYGAVYAGTADELHGGLTAGGSGTLGNTAAGSWAKVANLDFGANAPVSFGVEAAVPAELAGGTISVRLDRPDGPEIGVLTVAATGGWDDYVPQRTTLSAPSAAVGIHDVYFVFSRSGTANIGRFVFAGDIAFSPDGSGTPAPEAETTISVAGDGAGFDPEAFEYAWSESTVPPVGGWSSFTPGDTIVKYLAGDGDWYMHVRGLDLVGNRIYARSDVFMLENSHTQFTGLEISAGSSRSKLSAGQTLQLAVTGLAGPYSAALPETTFAYTSSDSAVATVDAAGVVTAVGLGMATISVAATVYDQPLSGEFVVSVVTTRDAYAAWYAGTADELHGGPSASGLAIGNTAPGSWAKFANVDFGSSAPSRFGLEAAVPDSLAGGTVSIRIDRPDGPEIGRLTIAGTDDWDDYELQETLLSSPAPAVGIHDVYLVFSNYGTCNARLVVFSPDTFIEPD